jgi:hypothetical protein
MQTAQVRVLFVQQASHRLTTFASDSAGRSSVSFRVLAKPPFAMTQQFVDFGITDVIVFLLVESRQQHVEVRKGIVNRHPGFECQAKIAALAPIRKLLVEWDRRNVDFVAQQFEEPSQDIRLRRARG